MGMNFDITSCSDVSEPNKTSRHTSQKIRRHSEPTIDTKRYGDSAKTGRGIKLLEGQMCESAKNVIKYNTKCVVFRCVWKL